MQPLIITLTDGQNCSYLHIKHLEMLLSVRLRILLRRIQEQLLHHQDTAEMLCCTFVHPTTKQSFTPLLLLRTDGGASCFFGMVENHITPSTTAPQYVLLLTRA